MLGRLIVALLVICSAAAVVWHRQKAESADVGAAVAEDKAAAAEQRAEAAEKRAAAAEERARDAEARAAYFEGQAAARSAAAEDPVLAEHKLHIVSVDWRGVHTDRRGRDAGRLVVALAGDAADVSRIRVFSSTVAGRPVWSGTWDTRDVSRWPLDVFHGGKIIVDAHADDVIHTRGGGTLLELSMPVTTAVLAPGLSYTVEVTAGDAVLQRTFTL